MKQLSLFLLITLLFQFALSQNSTGYWDQLRSQKKAFRLQANTRQLFELGIPYGTTELIYRVTVLPTNKEITNSIADLAGSFKTPKMLAASGAISLVGKVMGDDKCKFYIFKGSSDAATYKQKGLVKNTCYAETNPTVTSDGYFNNNGCINVYSNKLYFGIETTNLKLPSDIIIEILPWVEPAMERGWTKEASNAIYNYLAEKYNEDILDCMMSKITENYTAMELTKVNQTDEDRILGGYAHNCLDELGLSKEVDEEVDNEYRDEADSLIDAGNYEEAIEIYLMFDEDTTANIADYTSLGWAYILSKQYLKAIKYLKKGELLDDTDLLIQGNLAHAYLLSGDFTKANIIYQKYRGQNVAVGMSWEKMVNEDFNTFKEKRIACSRCQEILDSFEATKE